MSTRAIIVRQSDTDKVKGYTGRTINIPFIDIHVDPKDPLPGSRKLLDILRPEWGGGCIIKELPGGSGNVMMLCRHVMDDECKNAMVIRVRGVGQHFAPWLNRQSEILGLVLGHQTGCNRQMNAIFKNGLVVGYAPGRNMTYGDYSNPAVAKRTAQTIAYFHSIDTDKFKVVDTRGHRYHINKEDLVFDKMRSSIWHIPERRFSEIADLPSRDDLINEVTTIEKYVLSMKLPLVFCHNDFQMQNMIYDDKGGKVRLIDFEIVYHSYAPMDLAIVLADRSVLTTAGWTTDEEPLMTEEARRTWFRDYLYYKNEADGKAETDISDAEVEEFFTLVKKFLPIRYFKNMILAALTPENQQSEEHWQRSGSGASFAWKKYSSLKAELWE